MVTAQGLTTTTDLADSVPTIIAEARQVREYAGRMSQLVDRRTLGRGLGLNWNEVSMAQVTAMAITETTVNDNAQTLSDTLFTIRPQKIQVLIFVSDTVRDRISKIAFRELGGLAMNAIVRKKDQDGLVILQGAGTNVAGAGTTLVSGNIAAAQTQIAGNTTEPGEGPYNSVLHSFQLKDIHSEITSPVGTDELTSGVSANVFRSGFYRGTISTVNMVNDDNIAIDSSTDATGGVWAKRGIVMVQGRSMRVETKREPGVGGGGNKVFTNDEFAYGERSSGNWLRGVPSDATVPTS